MIGTKEKTMKCIHCQGRMERTTAPFQVDRKGYHLVLEAVPAWVCSQCGEAYFEEREVEGIQDVIRAVDKRTEQMLASSPA
jgi:YgiT-type zinc finger domain-containing protein